MRCPSCDSEISNGARRCPHCTSVISEVRAGKGTAWAAIKGFFLGLAFCFFFGGILMMFGAASVGGLLMASSVVIAPLASYATYKQGYTKRVAK